jgi:transcriptional regulator with XRE-family HTH domain
MALVVLAKPALRKARIKKGFTQAKFAEHIGYSTAGYGKVELMRNGMRPRGVDKILTALEKPFDELFEFVDGEEYFNG